MEPIAEYVETLLGGRRTFSLYADKLRFEAAGAVVPQVLIEFPLADLDPAYTRIVVPAADLAHGIGMLLLGAFMAALIGYQSRTFLLEFPLGIMLLLLTVVFVGVCAGGILMIAKSRRKIVFVAFHPPGRQGFDMGKRGKFQDQFDNFVAILVAKIERAHREKAQAQQPGA